MDTQLLTDVATAAAFLFFVLWLNERNHRDGKK